MLYDDLVFPFALYDVDDYTLQDSVVVHSQAEYDLLDKERWLKFHDALDIQTAVNERMKEIDAEVEAAHNGDETELQEIQSGIDFKKLIYPISMVNPEGEIKIIGTRRTAEKYHSEGWLPK